MGTRGKRGSVERPKEEHFGGESERIHAAPFEDAPSPEEVLSEKARCAKSARRPLQTAFLVASTPVNRGDEPRLRVFAVIARGAAEVLTALRDALGAERDFEPAGKLSNWTAKALGLEPGEIRQV